MEFIPQSPATNYLIMLGIVALVTAMLEAANKKKP
jgi:hypothetical protein